MNNIVVVEGKRGRRMKERLLRVSNQWIEEKESNTIHLSTIIWDLWSDGEVYNWIIL